MVQAHTVTRPGRVGQGSTVTRRAGGRTAALGAVTALVVGTVLVRQEIPAPVPPPEPPAPVETCSSYSLDRLAERSFALLGTVTGLAALPAGDGAVRARLEVEEWFRGPALAVLDVSIPRAAVSDLWQAGGRGPAVGDRLLVAGDTWTSPSWPHPAVAWGCGWTRRADRGTTAEWAARRDTPTAPAPEVGGLHARYVRTGYTTATATLRGVLVRDGDCLYVQDGSRRWLPVFPADGSTRWHDETSVLDRGGVTVPLGYLAALGGGPAMAAGDPVAGFAVPQGCAGDVDRWVVAELPTDVRVRPRTLPSDAPFLRTARTVLEALGQEVTSVSGSTVDDAYGRTAMSALVDTRGPRLEVRVESPLPSVRRVEAYAAAPGDLSTTEVDGVEVTVVHATDGGYVQAVVLLHSGLVATVTDRAHPGGPNPDSMLLARIAAGIARA